MSSKKTDSNKSKFLAAIDRGSRFFSCDGYEYRAYAVCDAGVFVQRLEGGVIEVTEQVSLFGPPRLNVIDYSRPILLEWADLNVKIFVVESPVEQLLQLKQEKNNEDTGRTERRNSSTTQPKTKTRKRPQKT